MDVSVVGMIGLYGGMIFGIFGWWFGRKKAREQRGLDELHEHIWQQARSYSWYVTLGMIYIFFSFLVFGVDLSLAMVLGVLMLTHLASWAFIGIILTVKMQNTEQYEPSKLLIGIGIIVLSVLAFTIVTIIYDDWRFMLIGIPISLFGILFIKKPAKKMEQND
ncbi:hypothetical protein ACLIBG_12630 [Virgibacillus sp. W0181]|uniref:hypothetical protein n=1 Tax=Virgibacillus sp. W0181 TaxID=3391581 RepID=UPI003F48DF63